MNFTQQHGNVLVVGTSEPKDAKRNGGGRSVVDREKVINGLESFKADLKPYVGNAADWMKVDNAISALQYVCCGECRWSERFDEGMRCKLLSMEVYDKFYCAGGERR